MADRAGGLAVHDRLIPGSKLTATERNRERSRTPDAIGSVAAGGSAGVAGDDDAVLVGEDDSLHPVSQAELHQEAADVALDGRFRHDQSLGDLAVGESACHEYENFAL